MPKNMKPKIVVLTGAGISAESGLSTFRDSDGLWENYRIEEVCTPEALVRNRPLVIDFYNQRRKAALAAQPNAAHHALKRLEQKFDVCIVTQNVDNLHERAGSSHIIHLHGEVTKLRSSNNETATVPLDGWQQTLDARHPDGSLLRPFIVFFGENVPMLEPAIEQVRQADILIIVGTSLAVYPAAMLAAYAPTDTPIYLVDPGQPDTRNIINPFTHIQQPATIGVPQVVQALLDHA